MGKPTGFMEIARVTPAYKPVAERVQHFKDFVIPLLDADVSRQGARCMDCGIPFCQSGCPINNIIPDWNDLVYRGRWKEAIAVLHSTNNFPEFTGSICPAPCEASCTLNIEDSPVTIKNIERTIAEKAWMEGWIQPQPAVHKTGRKIAIVGSGPAGLAAAQQLARAGHAVVVFEKADRIGGLLRYGIPNFKMEKHVIDRRVKQMEAEGVEFRVGQHVGANLPAKKLLDEFDAVVLAAGSEKPRDLPVPGRELDGIHFAMDFLTQQTKTVLGDKVENQISAKGKHVVVIGGGDTGSDCIGTSVRQGALSVTQIELLPQPPAREDKGATWPYWPNKMRTSSSQEEGCSEEGRRQWSVNTRSFSGEGGRVTTLNAIRLDWKKDESGNWKMSEIPGSEFTLKADLVLLAMGFVHPVHEGMLKELGVELDGRGNIKADTDKYQTSLPRVFAAGDARRGQSLVVWAIREGRQCARAVDEFLMGFSELPR